VGSHGDIAAASLQVNKTISAGEGGVVYTNDARLFERAVRFHDVGAMRAPHQQWIGAEPALQPFPGSNFRMNELTGAVLLAQFRKLTTVVSDIRRVARGVYDGTRDLPGVTYRGLPDPVGELGVGVYFDLRTPERARAFLDGMKAQNVPCSHPSGSVFLPAQNYVRDKVAVNARWPSYTVGRGASLSYDPALFAQTASILARFAGPPLDPKYSPQDTRDIVTAIRRVWSTLPA
jgi:8-amino-3,8-dideoxy-alpha-D-manno-octulosonate transaminase